LCSRQSDNALLASSSWLEAKNANSSSLETLRSRISTGWKAEISAKMVVACLILRLKMALQVTHEQNIRNGFPLRRRQL
jgi:hypothetical protein